MGELSLGRGIASKDPVLGMLNASRKGKGEAHERASPVASFWGHCLRVEAASKKNMYIEHRPWPWLEPVSRL